MRSVKTICDFCLTELSEPTQRPDHFLTLSANRRPNTNMVYAVHIEPLIDEDKHFCGIGCLHQWIVKNFPNLKKD